MDLYLVRHAIAHDRDSERWPDDSARPLCDAGVKRFRRAAAGLGAGIPRPDELYSSPYLRAWETAELLARVAKWPAPKRLPLLAEPPSLPRLAQVLASHAKGARIALVGHEPYLGELATRLLLPGEGAALFEFKKGGIACLRLDGGLVPGAAILRWFLSPRLLRAFHG